MTVPRSASRIRPLRGTPPGRRARAPVGRSCSACRAPVRRRPSSSRTTPLLATRHQRRRRGRGDLHRFGQPDAPVQPHRRQHRRGGRERRPGGLRRHGHRHRELVGLQHRPGRGLQRRPVERRFPDDQPVPVPQEYSQPDDDQRRWGLHPDGHLPDRFGSNPVALANLTRVIGLPVSWSATNGHPFGPAGDNPGQCHGDGDADQQQYLRQQHRQRHGRQRHRHRDPDSPVPGPDGRQTNNVGGTTVLPTGWNWTVHIANGGRLCGIANGSTLLTDTLPNTGLTYGAPAVSGASGLTGTITCAIDGSSDLAARQRAGQLAAGGSFDVVIGVTPSAVGPFANRAPPQLCGRPGQPDARDQRGQQHLQQYGPRSTRRRRSPAPPARLSPSAAPAPLRSQRPPATRLRRPSVKPVPCRPA